MNLLIASAHAQAAAGGDGGNAGLIAQALQFAPLAVIFVVFYVILIRPQQQKQKESRTMLAALRRGDRVVTGGGIVATVQRVRDGTDEIEVEIAPNVRVVVLRDTISNVVKPKPANDVGTKT